MIEEQQPLPDVPEPDDDYRPPVESMNQFQVERELRDLFGIAIMYMLVPLFLVIVCLPSMVRGSLLIKVLPALAAVFVGYWGLLRAYVPIYESSPDMALQYLRLISRIGGGIMSTSHSRTLSLCARRLELNDSQDLN
ncbi:hypothetical protein [Blastopirellula marina]|uniref:Uncharacterized protein n=1 Tax=Blastopirellula marina TaxID=124 RepID=A0A2S8GLX7_9BACT|nr:hypothetical protein [Blastopirellula marina]PQO45439.1 hypothetical protein C5Y93_13385 [Blastopirellula marina]